MDIGAGRKRKAADAPEDDDEDGPVIVGLDEVSIRFDDGGDAHAAARAEGGADGAHATAAAAAASQAPPASEGTTLLEWGCRSCCHAVVWPPRQQGPSMPPPEYGGLPAKSFSFRLDPFQQTAVNALEAGHSVLVSAHTSAGKTVVAEYAFAMALRDHQRVIYTSPLKALSHQKYRQLQDEFNDVGLMTGDVTINEGASCLVMMTEVLRDMMYRGAEAVHDAQLLVFDEAHYLSDPERGVVWEEAVILAPHTCRFVFLSATIPNATQFAQWVSRTHGSPIHVITMGDRPTPLQHYIYPAGGEAAYLVVDERGTFKQDNVLRALAAIPPGAAAARGGADAKWRNTGVKQGRTEVKEGLPQNVGMFKLVRMIMDRALDPAIVFCFTRRECESLALDLTCLDLTDEGEKRAIHTVWSNAVECLSQEEQRLPAIVHLLPLLRRGIALHHAGLLPVLRELVELLFQQGLIKVLFATETLALGLHLPAKTVVFSQLRKYDGARNRWLTAGEYTQMSGRAGRRGLDDRGVVFVLLDTRIDHVLLRGIMAGGPPPLRSAFRLTHHMLLRLPWTGAFTPEKLVASSFKQFQLEQSLPELRIQVQALLEQYESIKVQDEEQVRDYLDLLQQWCRLQAQLRVVATQPRHCLLFLQPGRLVRLLPSFRSTSGAGHSSQGPYSLPDLSHLSDEDVRATAADYGDDLAGGLAAVASGGVWGCVVAFERVASQQGSGTHVWGAVGESFAEGSTGEGSRQYLVHVLVNVPLEGPLVVEDEGLQGSRYEHGVAESVGGVGGSVGDMSAGRAGAGVQGTNAAAMGFGGRRLRLLPPGTKSAVPQVLALPLAQIDCLSSVRVYVRKDLRSQEARQAGVRCVAEAVRRQAQQYGRVPTLDLEEDLKVEDRSSLKLVNKVEGVERRLSEHPLAAGPGLRARLAQLQRKLLLGEQLKALQSDLRAGQDVILRDELRRMQRLLRKLGYVDTRDNLTDKGKVASLLQQGHALVLTELLFGGALSRATPDQLVAACSCFVCQEPAQPGMQLSEEMADLLGHVQRAARRVLKASARCKLQVDEQGFISSFQPLLMEVMAAWCRGARLADILKMTPMFEGSVVRAIKRLQDLLRQVHEGLKRTGQQVLADTVRAACQRVDRDALSAASLYL